MGALLVVGANPLVKLAAKADRLKSTFLVVQDLFSDRDGERWPMWCCLRRVSTKNPAR